MDSGKIISIDSVARLRKHLQRYDSCSVTCTEVTESAAENIVSTIQAHPEVVTCSYGQNTFEIASERLELVLLDALKAIRKHNLNIEAVGTNEPTLEEIFLGTVSSGAPV